MADKRRRIPLALGPVISLTNLRAELTAYQQDEPVDEPVARTNRVVGRPLRISALDEFKTALRHQVLWRKAAVYRRIAPQPGSRPGRRRAWDPAWIAIIEDTWHKFHSITAVFDQLGDVDVVQVIREYARAYGQELGPPPGSRTAYLRFLKEFVDDRPELQDELDDCQLADALLEHELLTAGSGAGTIAFPAENEVAVGDGTWIPSRSRSGVVRRVNPNTGEVTETIDRNAQPLPGGEGTGNFWTTVSTRLAQSTARTLTTFHTERILFDCRPTLAGREGEAAVEILTRMQQKGSRVRGLGFDMGMHAKEIDRCLRLGITPFVKTPRIAKQGPAFGSLGRRKLKAKTGATEVELFYLDGCPGLITVVGDEELFVRLALRQSRHPHGRYNLYVVPDHPVVEPSLRGAEYLHRITATAAERDADDYPSAKVRPVPECHDYFQEVFGLREDVESMHKHLKERMFGGRALSWNLERQRMLMRGYRSRSNLRAALAHETRTGTDLAPILIPAQQLSWQVALPPAA